MKTYTPKELEGKFIVAYDTIIDGNQCMMDGEEGDDDYAPSLFDSEDEAFDEIFDANHSILDSHKLSNQLEELNEGVTPELVDEMLVVLKSRDVDKMREFMNEHPECDDSGEWVEKADEFIMNRKAIFDGQGIFITGTKLSG